MIKINQEIIVKSANISKNYVYKKLNLKVYKVNGKGLSTDGINFTDLHVSNPKIYDVVYNYSNNIWNGLIFSGWSAESA